MMRYIFRFRPDGTIYETIRKEKDLPFEGISWRSSNLLDMDIAINMDNEGEALNEACILRAKAIMVKTGIQEEAYLAFKDALHKG